MIDSASHSQSDSHPSSLAPGIGLLVLIAYTIVRDIFAAASKPFWYDELCTVAVAGQPNLQRLWHAFHQCKDGSTLLYCLVEHVSSKIVPNAEIAYRLPSIFGCCCVLLCVFLFLCKRVGPALALPCVAILLLTPLNRTYAIEARSYALFAACIAFALVCYQHAPAIRWMIFMGLCLAMAEAFHYLAFVVFFPFVLAELVWTLREKRLRWGVWLALAAGFLPLLPGLPVLASLKRFYGPNFWGKPRAVLIGYVYSFFFRTRPSFALSIAVALSLAALCLTILIARRIGPGKRMPDESFHEPLLVVGFLALPYVLFVFAELVHGSFVDRYILCAVLAIPLAVACFLLLLGRWSAVPFMLFLSLALGAQEILFWNGVRGHLGRLVSPATSAAPLINSAGYSDLPLVVSDGHDYVQLAYYASPELANRLVFLVDPARAVIYAGNDSVDRQTNVMQCCLPLRVYAFQDFAPEHPRFLLYWGGGPFDWWPRRLRDDGYSLQIAAAQGGNTIYLVTRDRTSP